MEGPFKFESVFAVLYIGPIVSGLLKTFARLIERIAGDRIKNPTLKNLVAGMLSLITLVGLFLMVGYTARLVHSL